MSRRSLFTLGSAPEAAHTEPAVPGLDALPRTASPRDVLLAARREPALPRLLVTDACTACGGCVRICPTDALSLDGGTLRLSPRACVGCGECARVCPEEAVSVDGRGVEQGVHVLQQVSHGRCGRCDRRLGPGEGAVCHACTTRASLLDGIWAQLDG